MGRKTQGVTQGSGGHTQRSQVKEEVTGVEKKNNKDNIDKENRKITNK